MFDRYEPTTHNGRRPSKYQNEYGQTIHLELQSNLRFPLTTQFEEELKKINVDANLVSIFQLGTELNDIETLVPWTLSKTLEKMKELAFCVIEKKGQVMQIGEWFDEIKLQSGPDLKFKSQIDKM